MPSYPGSIFAPAARSNGQTIDAAHVNDIQDEIAAIEQGIRNGTGPLNSSGSTLASLNVVGSANIPSCTMGSVVVSGNQSIQGGLLVVQGSTFLVRPLAPPPECAKVYLDSSGAIGTSAASTVSWVAQDFVTNSSMHSTATDPQRLTPQTTGVYQVSAQLRTDTPSSANRLLAIFDSSGTAIAAQRVTNSTAVTLAVTGYKRFDALGGYAKVSFITDGSSHSLVPGIGDTWFAMVKL